MRTLLLVLIAICLLPARAISGPDATTNHLMSDSASMLDFGLLRLNLSLEAKSLGTAYFDWDANRVHVSVFFAESEAAGTEEETCSKWVDDVRLHAQINRDTGNPFLKVSRFAGYFAHSNFRRNAMPDTLYEDIDKLFVMTCTMAVKGGDFITISAPLLGTGYSLQK